MSWSISEWRDLLGLRRVQLECMRIILRCLLMWANISNNSVCTTRQPIRKAVQKWSICTFLVAVHVPTLSGTHILKAPLCSSMMQKTASRTDYIEQRYRQNSTIWTRSCTCVRATCLTCANSPFSMHSTPSSYPFLLEKAVLERYFNSLFNAHIHSLNRCSKVGEKRVIHTQTCGFRIVLPIYQW